MIQIDDIIKRSRYLNLSKNHEYDKYHNKVKTLSESNVYRFEDKKFLLQHWESLDKNQVECFKKCINILDEAYELDNKGDFNYIKSYIINEVTPTVRDAKQTARYLKYKTTRLKNKITEKVKKNVEDIKNTSKNIIDKTKESDKKTINNIKSNVKKSLGQKDINEAYVEILDSLNKYIHCDRILENTYTVQKRFNIMNMIENTDISNDASLRALVDSICECINTYDADFSTRLNTTLETCFYFLSRNNKNFNKSLVLEEVVNNFISGDLPYNNLLEMRSIIESSVVYDEIEKSNIEFIYTATPYDEETYTDTKNESVNIELDMLESNFIMDLDIYSEAFKPSNIVNNIKNNKDVKEIVNDFKVKKMKSTLDIRTCLSRMFTKSPDQIIDGTPNFLSWLRLSYVVGAASVSPVLGAVTLLVDQFISMNLKRRDVSKMITVFKNERKNVAEKLKRTVDDGDKKNLKDYDKYLEKGIEKLEEYSDSLLSSYELSNKLSGEKFDRDEAIKDITGDEDTDDDLDFDYNLEATNFEKLFDRSNNFSSEYFTSNIKKHISIMDENTIDVITNIACMYPSIISTNKLYSILKEELENMSDRRDYSKKSCLMSNIRKLDPDSSDYMVATSNDMEVFTVINGLEDLFAEYSIADTLKTESADTSIKMLSNKLRSIVNKVKDADKEASRKIDSAVNMFLSGMQRAARNDNREAIIKGSILPSASKIIKAAIIDGAVALVNPAVAVILALGQFAVRKKMQIKERQLVLDEIDIELEMTKRYLRRAEDRNDLKAQKQLLIIQRNLERQKQRIQYNMKVNWKQDVPDVGEKDDD